MEALSFIIFIAICYAAYYWLSPKKKRERKFQTERTVLEEKSSKWRTHPLFPKALSACEEFINDRLEHAKAETYTVDAAGRGKSDTFAIEYDYYSNQLRAGLSRLDFHLDTSMYSPLTQDQAAALIRALHHELSAQYGPLSGVVIKYQDSCGAHSASVFFDITALHPKKYLQDIGV